MTVPNTDDFTIVSSKKKRKGYQDPYRFVPDIWIIDLEDPAVAVEIPYMEDIDGTAKAFEINLNHFSDWNKKNASTHYRKRTLKNK